MTTALYTHPDCLKHDTGPGHPECVDRLRVILAALEAEEFALLDRRAAPRADKAALERVHAKTYVRRVLSSMPAEGYRRLDPDTVVCPDSGEAALRAAGAVVAAVDAVMAGEVRNAFCAVRPPGHHAEPDRAMGFCLFNNVAVGALHAVHRYGLARAAVVDFDVHHGNGTQTVAEHDDRLFYASLHQYPFYPGTGAPHETGRGNVVNLALDAGAGSTVFRSGFEGRVIPALEAFGPELIFISAGFDGHALDPLAGLNLSTDDFAWATTQLCTVADRLCNARVVSVLEGGYNLGVLGACAAAHVRALMTH
ncbi:MAG: histone deacetylase family protein [Alphaproteobacteria bacterium]|nr:MAG: histone deacetylase family protein [Alphaproteobacteria bacterium]